MAFNRKVTDPVNSVNADDTECLLESKEPDPEPETCIRQRFVMALSCFFGFAIAYSSRINLSVILVAMVNATYVAEQNEGSNTSIDACPNLIASNTTNKYNGEFNWNPYMQGVISSGFYYGYIFSQIIGGLVADKYGGKHVLGFSILFSSLISMLTPVAARTDFYLLIAVRVVEGFIQGVIYPASMSLIAAWSPINERALLSMFPTFGVYMGIIIAFPVSGVLCEVGFAGGWPSAFYVFGMTSLLWYPAWLYLISNTPREHPRISRRELAYIQEGLPPSKRIKPAVPWRSLLTSIRVWAVVIAVGGSAFGYGAILAFLPMYLKEVLKLGLISGGFVSIVPYIVTLVSTVAGGYFGDFFAVKFHSVTASRKIITVLSHVVCGIFIICIPAVGCHRAAVVAILSLSCFFSGFSIGGVMVNCIDLAPQYSGSIMGLSNTAGSLGMILGPFATGALTSHAQTLEAWARAFYVMAAITILAGVFYLIFGSGNLQSWATMKQEVIVNEAESESEDYSNLERNRDIRTV